jgi:hypothetical protein
MVAGAALALALLLQLDASRVTSAVVDEPAHLTAGYLYLAERDPAINREHPPLLKALAALPLLAMKPVIPPRDPDGPVPGSEDFEFDYARAFLYRANDADRLLRAARIPMMILTALLGILVFLWAREIAGAWGGAAAVVLYATEPNILAHGRLVTTDLGAAAFCLGAVWSLRRVLRAPSPANAAIFGLLLGAALLSKFSALILLPLGAALIAADLLLARAGASLAPPVARPKDASAGPGDARSPLSERPAAGREGRRPSMARIAGITGIAIGTAWAILLAGYLFRGFPLPGDYLEGIEIARTKNATVEGPTYLLGAVSPDGFWSYFVIALVLKVPIPVLVLAAWGKWSLLLGTRARGSRRRAEVQWSHRLRREAVWLLLPPLVWLAAMTIMTRAQIGVRYVLPVIPFLCILGGIGAVSFYRRIEVPPGEPDTGARSDTALLASVAACALLFGWQMLSAARIHPHQIAYFNLLGGGPDMAWRRLCDSNLDWGQDLKGLASWLESRGNPPVNLYYFGTADPDYYGIRRIPPESPAPGLFAVSATHLTGVYLPDRDYLADFRAMTPLVTIGHSILVFELPDIPERLRQPLRRPAAAGKTR